jgi:hypothetical protein
MASCHLQDLTAETGPHGSLHREPLLVATRQPERDQILRIGHRGRNALDCKPEDITRRTRHPLLQSVDRFPVFVAVPEPGVAAHSRVPTIGRLKTDCVDQASVDDARRCPRGQGGWRSSSKTQPPIGSVSAHISIQRADA